MSSLFSLSKSFFIVIAGTKISLANALRFNFSMLLADPLTSVCKPFSQFFSSSLAFGALISAIVSYASALASSFSSRVLGG